MPQGRIARLVVKAQWQERKSHSGWQTMVSPPFCMLYLTILILIDYKRFVYSDD